MQTHQKTALGNLANTAAYTGRRKVNCAKFSAIEWGRNNAMLSCFQAAHDCTTICCQRSRFAGWSWSGCLSECWAAMQFLEWEEGRVEQSWEMLSIWLMRDICVRISGQLDPWLTWDKEGDRKTGRFVMCASTPIHIWAESDPMAASASSSPPRFSFKRQPREYPQRTKNWANMDYANIWNKIASGAPCSTLFYYIFLVPQQ
jgi:hypothetical protein